MACWITRSSMVGMPNKRFPPSGHVNYIWLSQRALPVEVDTHRLTAGFCIVANVYLPSLQIARSLNHQHPLRLYLHTLVAMRV